MSICTLCLPTALMLFIFDPMFRIPINASSNMEPLRPISCEKPLTEATVKAALRVAPCVVVKERGQNYWKL